MKVLVTGATGFIGGNLVRELLYQGYQVRALVREASDRRTLTGLDVEVAVGDLLNKDSLRDALDGCEGLFHVAAVYSLWTPDPEKVYETNVNGTANLLSVALSMGTKRVVFTGSESTVKVPDSSGLGTEREFEDIQKLGGHYKKSKLLAEKLALSMCRRGLPLVVVNPTTPVGPGDVKPTPTGQFIVDFLNGRMPAYVNTGLNLIDVGDVAKGHILAFERGRPGERYLLGNRNVTFREILEMLADLTGATAPKLRIPLWLALSAAHIDERFVAPILRKPPRIPMAGVVAARKFRHFDCSKAVRELGLPQTPIEVALAKAVRWFKQNGYVRKK